MKQTLTSFKLVSGLVKSELMKSHLSLRIDKTGANSSQKQQQHFPWRLLSEVNAMSRRV